MDDVQELGFRLEERTEGDWVRLMLSGELDLAVAEQLESRLGELQGRGCRVVLDLSRLRFIDSTGIALLIRAVAQARDTNWQLEVEPEITPQVRRLFEVVGAQSYLWPASL
jgi:anti-anti-sigma factor